ncbi:MAG: alcohol dehydrogenase catalytic domain-containing protein [Chloroflexi bacterium]|nr:alcohol dehydrogenase catalytic domain-containing protein [Chloroflexota bacterium]
MPRIELDDDLLIAVEACGICGSDLQILNVPPGHPATPGTILGHEFVGRVEAIGAGVTAIDVGWRVVVDPDPKCGICQSCQAGRPANCEHIVALGVYRDGGLASHVIAPAAAVYRIAEDVPTARAALVEPLACVINGTNRAAVRPGESVVVMGAGTIGCLFVAVFAAAGAGPLIVVEPNPVRAAVAAAVGADVTLTPEEFQERRQALLPNGADVVVDAVGSLLPAAIEAAGMGGRIVLFGMNGAARPAIHQVEITEKGLTILGSYISNFTFPTAIRLVEAGSLVLDPIVTTVLPLDQVVDGLASLRSGDATKVVITP